MKSFDWSQEAATMISSYMLFAFCAGNLLGGILNDKKGPRLTGDPRDHLFLPRRRPDGPSDKRND
jgi:hypothetical protein